MYYPIRENVIKEAIKEGKAYVTIWWDDKDDVIEVYEVSEKGIECLKKGIYYFEEWMDGCLGCFVGGESHWKMTTTIPKLIVTSQKI